jgi:hypothetical protein
MRPRMTRISSAGSSGNRRRPIFGSAAPIAVSRRTRSLVSILASYSSTANVANLASPHAPSAPPTYGYFLSGVLVRGWSSEGGSWYRSGLSKSWLKMKSPNSPAMLRLVEEMAWGWAEPPRPPGLLAEQQGRISRPVVVC